MKNDPLQLGSWVPIVPDFTVCVSGQQKPIPGVPFSLFLVCGVSANLEKVFKLPNPFSMVTVHCTCLSWGQNMSFQHTHKRTSAVHLWTEQRENHPRKLSSVAGQRPILGGHLGFCAMYKICLCIWRVSRLVRPQGRFLQECERTGWVPHKRGERAWHLECGALVLCKRKTRASPEWHKLACMTRWGRTCCPL